MNIAQTIPLADGWGMHSGGWWIVPGVLMMLFMGGMMWMMMRGMGAGSSQESPPPGESPGRESPVEILERRFAEGAISIEEYEARREALVNGGSGPNGAHKDEPLVAASAGEGRR